MKYRSKRGKIYQFSRRVPDDVRDVIGKKHWRNSLETDSETVADVRCRRRTVETDEIIQKVRDGKYRSLTQLEVEDIAIQWSLEFQMENREGVAYEMFPDVLDDLRPLDTQKPSPIFPNRRALSQSLRLWVQQQGISITSGSPDWEAVVEACLDEYLTANPEISDGWKDVLAAQKIDLGRKPANFIPVVSKEVPVSKDKKLSNVFSKYAKDEELGESARLDYATATRRFVELHGDIDVSTITRRHAEEFRDMLRQLPSRPPNDVRKLSMPDQVTWAEGRSIKRLGQSAINKNLGGVKLTLEFGFEQTSVFENRDWRNPFDGFARKPKRPKNPIKPFNADQIAIIFSDEVFRPKSAERFWIPLILYYSGARLDEISQLHVGDVHLSPVAHLKLENLEDEDAELAKKLKTESSHRSVPLHKHLIDIGFLDYWRATKDAGHIHLFPNLPHKQGRKRGNSLSRQFMKSFREYGAAFPSSSLVSESYRTHSLRHSFRTFAYHKLDQAFVQVVMGHYVEGVSFEVYGSEIYHMPEVLADRVINKIQLPDLEIDKLKIKARDFLEAK